MPTQCWNSVRGKVARVTKTDDCCRPLEGPCSTVVTDGFVTVNYSPEIEEGEEILVRKADGAICVNDKSCDTLKRVNVEVEFCRVDPDLFALMTGNPVVLDWQGNSVGNRIGETLQCDGGFALEVWSNIPGQNCSVTGAAQYGYFLVPCMSGGTIGEFTIENNAATFTVTAYSKSGEGWGQGPYNVDGQDADNTPGPLLTAFEAGEHMDMHLVTIPPPEATCGCIELVIVGGPDAPADFAAAEDPDDPTQALLTWTAPDPAPTGGYRLFRDGQYLDNVGFDQSSYTATNLVSGRTYEFALAAVDGTGNASDTPATVSYTAP